MAVTDTGGQYKKGSMRLLAAFGFRLLLVISYYTM